MKKWIWVLAYDDKRPSDQRPLVAFVHVFIDAENADEAYEKGAKRGAITWPERIIKSGMNDYVVEIG